PEKRVKRGLGRTFQINALFDGLSVVENVLLAVSERHGAAGDMLRFAGSRRDLVDEAEALLERLGLADHAARPVRELPYGQQRLVEIAIASASTPRCCCSTSRPPACPRRRAASSSTSSKVSGATSPCSSSSTTWISSSASPNASRSWCR